MSDLALNLIRAAKKKRLTRLELGRCGLTELPEELFALEWLEELVVSNSYWDRKKQEWIESQNQGEHNRLSQIPRSISRLTKLRTLFIKGGPTDPSEIGDLSPLATLANLRWLEVGYSQVSDLSQLEKLTNLLGLNVSWTQVSDLSPLERLANLRTLAVYNTRISDLSPLEKLANLEWLSVSDTQVSDLSPLEKLANLEWLSVSDTQVSDLSPLEKLTNLQWLSVSDTQVSDLSPLEKLTNLKVLAAYETQVSDLRPLLPLIEKGIPVKWDKSWWEGDSGIYVQDCPLSHPLPEIVQQGNEAILNYFRQIEEQGGTEPLYEARLLIVGEPGAGKTSLMKKLLDPTYRVPPPQGEESTVGINVHEGWPFPYAPQPDIAFTANLWDFGGQEIQYMTHQFFLSPRSLYVLTADDRKQHTNFAYWFEVIHLLGKGEDGTQSPILVALNENNHKSVTNYDHRAYTERYPNTLIEKREVDLSLDDGRFKALQHKIQDMLCRLKHVGNPLPRLWRPIRNALKELANQHNHISEREFMEVCSDHGLKQQKAQLLLSDYLHCLGVILHYRNDPHLRDFIILNPQWAVEAVYSVLSDDRVKKTAGRFDWKFLEEVWRDYSREERSRLLMLMTKNNFEICYDIADGQQYIAPQLLDDVKPVYSWEGVNSLKFRFRYRFMPKGILTRLIVRLNEHIAWEGGVPLVWGKGVVLGKDGGRAQVIEDEFQQRIIDIEVIGSDSQKKYVMRWVRDEVEAIHRKWFKNVDFERMVPCNCEVCNTASEPTFFAYSELLQYDEERETHIKCRKGKIKAVLVRGLLEGIFVEEEIQKSKMELNREREMPDIHIHLPEMKPVTMQPRPEPHAMPQPVPMKWYEEWWVKSLGLGSIFGSLAYYFFNSSNLAVAVLALVFVYFFLRNPKRRFFWAATGILSAISLFNVLPFLDAQFHLSQGTKRGHIDLLFKLGIDDNTLLNSVLIGLAGFLFWLDSRKD